ncbi:MAG: hypothetical protein NC489_28010 [Ruminococcus flavefaciens]|nr:hypothetical protein [Ruminococcus flavefaciens]
MTYLINYADENFRSTQRFNSFTGKHIAKFDKVIEYSPADIDDEFYRENKEILDQKRGSGLWLWKPYIIMKTLEQVNDGDVVFYCDAGAYFIRNPHEWFALIREENIWCSVLPLIEEQFTKKSVFKALKADNAIKKNRQFQASFFSVKKCEEGLGFVKEWLELCKKAELLVPVHNVSNEGENFIAHREDQSILSVLLKKHYAKEYQDPTQYYRFPEIYKYQLEKKYDEINVKYNPYTKKDYKPFILLHRRRKITAKILLMIPYYCLLPKSFVLRHTVRVIK